MISGQVDGQVQCLPPIATANVVHVPPGAAIPACAFPCAICRKAGRQ